MKLFNILKYYYNDFLNYSFINKYFHKYYKWKCNKKLKKFILQNQECSLYLGQAGSGKTTYIAYIVNLCNVVGYKCFCNVPIHGAYPYSKDDIGVHNMENAIVLLDEAGISYDNRQFSTAFSEQSLTWLKLLRHYKVNIALFSQSLDIDAKWVRMSKFIYFVRRSLIPGFTSLRKVKRTLDVNPETHKLEDFYDKPSGIFSLIFHFRFRRKPYYKLFDSWDAPKLKEFPKIKKYERYNLLNKGD